MNGEPIPTVLVHDWLTGMRGGEKVLEQIASDHPQAPIHTLFHFPGTVSAALESHPIRTSFLQRAPLLRSRYRYYLPLYPRAIESLRLPPCRFVLGTSHAVAKGVRKPPGSLHVCYCHTPMRYVWDQQDAYFPPGGGPLAALRRLLLARLRRWDVATVDRVDRYVANSTFVADRIRRYYGRAAEVLHPPVDTDFFRPDPSVRREEFCLAVSALAPYKRIDVAMAACGRLGLELRVVGTGPERARLARGAGGGGVRFLGRVGAVRLRDLYRRALCFVQPGVEDFGISAVEALACGCPVAALGRGGVTDIVADGRHGVLYGEAGDVAATAAAIDKLRNMRFNPLDLRAHAEGFSTHRFRHQFRQLLPEAYGLTS
ncbi:MAG: glycosyltransferase [Acidobacteriota bacterium]|nr:glycosyltransferase [Acidobacteriota bacterium]